MTCTKCGEKPKKNCGVFPKAVIEIDNPEKIVLLRKVLVPASMGDESTFPPAIGKYHNVLLEYEASGGIYLYSSDGIPTKLSSDATELQAQLNALRVRIREEEVARADADTALSNRITSLDNSLATVAKTGSYNDLTNKPTIGNATLTIKRNGTNVGTFTANSSTNKTANITVPTAVSELTNDANYATTTQLNNGLATKQDTLTAGNNIQINGNTISATDTTYTAGNAIDITNGEISADIHPADFFTASDSISDCGSNLSLDNTIASTLKSVELKGDTFQQTYSGKNLLRNTFNSPSTVSGVTFTKNPDGTITANGTATAEINFYPNGNDFYPIAEGTYTLSDGLSNPTSTAYFTYIDTNTSSPNYIYFNTAERVVTRTIPGGITIKPRIVIRKGQTLDNVVFKLMLEQSSTATSFEPYVGGIPAPSPDYPQNVRVVTGEQTIEVSDGNGQDQSYTVDLGLIELCKIDDYQDYIYKSGDDWYLHKEIEAFDLSTGTYVATTGSIRGLTNAPGIKYVPNNQTIGSAVTSGYKIRQGQGLGTAGVGWFAVDTNRVNFNTGGSTDPVGMLYYARETFYDTQIEDPVLVAQLNALAEARSYNDQTNIIVTAAGNNLPATLCVEAYRKSLSGVIEAIDNACTCGKKATHLVLSNPTTATWNETGSIAIPISDGSAVSMGTFVSTDVVFTKDDGTTMTVGDLYTALTNGKSFEIDLPFGEINSACARDSAAIVATVENAKLDGSSKQTLDQTSQGNLSEMYTSSVPVAVHLSSPWGGVLLDERFGVEHLTIDDDNTVTSSYRFVVNTYENFQPPN